MVQVPSCSCGGSSAGGGGTCASVVVNSGYCTDDVNANPLLVRTVIFCNGSVSTDIVNLDGTAYAGAYKICDPQCCPSSSGGAGIERHETLLHGELTLDNVTAQGFPVIPVGADFVHIENPPRGSAMARWKDDGIDPASGILDDAHYLNRGVWFEYRADFDTIKFISDEAIGSRIIYTFYRHI